MPDRDPAKPDEKTALAHDPSIAAGSAGPGARGMKQALKELSRRRAASAGMGGSDAIDRHHSRGRLTARERIEMLLDTASFREMGGLSGKAEDDAFTPSNTVMGTGRIDGRRVAVSADDATIRGGSVEATIPEKWIYAERYALEYRLPMVRLVDTAGGSIRTIEQVGYAPVPGYPTWPVVPLMDRVPVVGICLGACAGLGAVRVMASHFSVMVRGTSQLFVSGPPVVRAALGIETEKEALGGAAVHVHRTGLVHNAAEDEFDALAQARDFLSYLPTHDRELPPCVQPDDDPGRAEPVLRHLVPEDRRQGYDMRVLLDRVLDLGSIFEIGRHHGGSTITMLARLNGVPVGVIANDPQVLSGAMSLVAAQKTTRFVQLCDQFRLPVVNFVDQPGNLVGPEAENTGALLAAVEALKAIERSKMPWISIIVGRVYGVAGGLHGRKHGRNGQSINHRLAWPTARWGSLPVQGGVSAAFRREIAASADPAARQAELEVHYDALHSPFRTAERFGIPDILDPIETRPVLCDWIEDARRLTEVQLQDDLAHAR
ncbi:acyl-CoA carboxylase subunit beta [Tropicimonas isoalkanivorans]|uniref:Acetyl-CoA carboxylase, carboxyltransferase component n=1 Tax=Tropicimonas isoalkanivorans TaxID=441112 RepID=A0A1I1HXV8_9RHOB|nr:carboxyl transferase domain-containing protein [Tropicimonas isoalkanivorans]SFC28927.1 Acetyl-CoA carboxylase, carboxyltransferase component [Tropicimonas isoalkanivorans]